MRQSETRQAAGWDGHRWDELIVPEVRLVVVGPHQITVEGQRGDELGLVNLGAVKAMNLAGCLTGGWMGWDEGIIHEVCALHMIKFPLSSRGYK